MKMKMKIILILATSVLISCGTNKEAEKNSVALGKTTFNKNCVACHGNEGGGLAGDWKKPLLDGSYQAPPLNGTAHTWHHSPKTLLKTINSGSMTRGGKMPSFKDKLTAKEKQSILDYLYSIWPKEIQKKYSKRFRV